MPAQPVREEVADYLAGVKSAQSEEAKKLRFQNLLNRLFRDSVDARSVIDQMAHGGEKTIFNIPRKGTPKTGYADIAYSNVIIEWERDLAKTGRHAEDQLAEYLAGKWHSGERYDFSLIATDGRVWRIYAPNLDVLLSDAPPSRSGLRQVEAFEVKRDNEEAFFYFLDRHLFRTQRRRATLSDIQLDFGDSSRAFINTTQAMRRVMPDAAATASPVHVAFEQWQRFLQLAYGKFDEDSSVYLVHTYLSVFAKLLAYAVLKPAAQPDDDELRRVLTGDAFNALNVAHFVEGDFFYWVAQPAYFTALAPAFRELFNLIREYDFTDVEEDILKGVYQELIDIDTRHALGEYYTPDWLCERIVVELHLKRDSQVLDPACGSGSFLRAVVARLKREWPDMPPQQIADQVKGIDVHPLSVQIAKTTLLLALGESVARAARPVTLNVYLANTLFLSQDEGRKTLYTTGHHFLVRVDDQKLPLDMEPFIGHPDSFSRAIDLAQHLVESQAQSDVSLTKFTQAVHNRVEGTTLSDQNIAELYAVYRAMRRAAECGRDSIWQFVLQNNYQPVFMYRVFDVIVGNPPWLTYADITSGDYQELVRGIAKQYALMPSAKANNPHIDLAAVFLAHCGKYLAKPDAQIAFVLPRAFLTADQHHNVRAGVANGFKLTAVWDLDGVKPLFNVPACVLFAQASQPEGVGEESRRAVPHVGLGGRVFSGRLPRPHLHWEEAAAFLKEERTDWYFQELGTASSRKKRSALVRRRIAGGVGLNAYVDRFKQGATIVPRAFYFVKVEGDTQNLARRVVSVRTHPLARREAKKPWDDITLEGRVHGEFLFRTALARNIVPFVLINPPLVALPLNAVSSGTRSDETTTSAKHWALLSPEQLTASGKIETAQWFAKGERLWDERRSDSAKKGGMSAVERLDYQRGLTDQPAAARWAVLYNASGKDASACVTDVTSHGSRFMAESTTYVCFMATDDEAHYLCCYLNSGFANAAIKEFQAKGLFGERHVHKKILELPWPAFTGNNPWHRKLAALGREAATQALRVVGPQRDMELGTRDLGQLRLRVRREIATVLAEIDLLVQAISTGQDLRWMRDDWQRMIDAPPGSSNTHDPIELSDFLRAEREAWAHRELPKPGPTR
jgi:type I restriction-modification system DNA methylase subunit